jgi:hypothetical protein
VSHPERSEPEPSDREPSESESRDSDAQDRGWLDPESWTLVRAARRTEKFLAQFAPLRMSLAVPRTADFMARSWFSAEDGEIPRPAMSVAMAAQIALDEAILLGARGPSRFPRRAEYMRVGEEMRAASRFYEEQGWIDDPLSYHRDPPPLEEPLLLADRSLNGIAFERMSFDSNYAPHPGEPGRERWLGYFPNHIAHAWVLRHDDDAPRPWLVCIHGFAMGYPLMDLMAFRARHLHEKLGFNLVFPVLPLHGARKVSKLSGDEFLSFNLQNGILGMANAVWDIRRIISWVRAQDPVMVGAYGVSLGGYTTALLSSVEDGLDLSICGIPVTDFIDLMIAHSPRHVRDRGLEHGALGLEARRAWSVVSPLHLQPKTPPDGRFIYAGLGDRMAPPEQARELWHHWGEPEIDWYQGNHVGYLLTPEVQHFVDVALSPWSSPDGA